MAAEAFSGALSDRYRSVAGEVEVASLDELTGDEFASVTEERPKNPWLTPIVVVGVLLVVGSLVAARGLFGLGSLSAPALLPAPDSLAAAWGRAWDPIPGAPDQIPPPWLALMALGSTILLGQPEWLVTLLLCGVVPLALIAVYPACCGRHRRPPGAAVGRGQLRAAAGLAGRDEPGPAVAERVRDPAADAGAGGPGAGAAPSAGARGVARRLGRGCRAGRVWPRSSRRS